jgi:hypothetical protein
VVDKTHMAMGGHVFRSSARKKRSGKHDHEYMIHNVGADLQRQVCSICGQVSISASPPVGFRPRSAAAAGPLHSTDPPLTIVIDEVVAPVGLSWEFADRRARR